MFKILSFIGMINSEQHMTIEKEKYKHMKKILLYVIAVVVLIQLFRPTKNDSKNYTNDISKEVVVTDEIQKIIETSCADCHSNATVYPWYAEIAPISWYLASHVNEGKEHLNFSEWTSYNKHQKEHILKNLKEVMTSHEMPLQSYLILHENAQLSKEQYEVFLTWVNTIKIH